MRRPPACSPPPPSACSPPARRRRRRHRAGRPAARRRRPTRSASRRTPQLEVVIFNGGLGDQVRHRRAQPLVQEGVPEGEGQALSHARRSPPILQPRFAAGNPPDMVNNSGSKLMDFGALVADGQLADLTDAVRRAVAGQPGQEGPRHPDARHHRAGTFNGKPYVLNYVSTVFGLWYSGKLFKNNGWTAADDLGRVHRAAATKIKKARASPRSRYAGANAPYYQYNVILTSAAKIGGADVLKNIDNLEDGAWKADAVKQAAAAWAEIGAKYMRQELRGPEATPRCSCSRTRTRSRSTRRGAWLENEQAKDTPAGFEYQLMPLPERDRLGQAAGRPRSAPPPARGTSSRPRARTPGAAWSTCATCCPRRAPTGFTELTKAPTVVTGAAEGLRFPAGCRQLADGAEGGRQRRVQLLLRRLVQEAGRRVRAPPPTS